MCIYKFLNLLRIFWIYLMQIIEATLNLMKLYFFLIWCHMVTLSISLNEDEVQIQPPKDLQENKE